MLLYVYICALRAYVKGKIQHYLAVLGKFIVNIFVVVFLRRMTYTWDKLDQEHGLFSTNMKSSSFPFPYQNSSVCSLFISIVLSDHEPIYTESRNTSKHKKRTYRSIIVNTYRPFIHFHHGNPKNFLLCSLDVVHTFPLPNHQCQMRLILFQLPKLQGQR